MKKNVVVLGSTGSIGTQTLAVLRAFPDELSLLALSCRESHALISEQAQEFRPRFAGVLNESDKLSLPMETKLITGDDVNCTLAALDDADIVVIGLSGIAGLPALLSALNAGKTVALANKESIVCGYTLVKRALEAHGGKIIPVDSEHAALFQCMQNGAHGEIARLHLTASGGPFFGIPEDELASVTPEMASRHPVWSMGTKITVDSATLFNKGLEVIEASFLFDMPEDKISVLIHPQSIIHSMVEYKDGSTIAQLSKPDMRLSIQYALFYPRRMPRLIERLSLPDIGKLTFFDADTAPAIRLARAALKGGEHMSVVYNAANEAAVELFMERRIRFTDIRQAVEHAMMRTERTKIRTLEDILGVDSQARRIVRMQYGSIE